MQTTTIESARPTSPRKVRHVPTHEGEPVWFLDNLITVKVASSEGAPFTLVESTMPAGSHTPFHRHDAEDEAFYVLEGALRVFLDGGRTVDLAAGGFLHIPRGTPHGFRTLAPTRMLVLAGTDGFVDMVCEAGTPAPRRALPPDAPPDIARLEAACARHHIALLGPLPE